MTNDKTHQIDAPTFSVSQQPTELPLSALLTQRCVDFSNSPKAVEIIDKGIEKLFGNLVEDAFGSYSDFGKVMKTAMKAALPTNVENIIELERYNSLVTRLMREKWETAGIANGIVEQMTAMVTEFTNGETIPKFIMASDLWKAFIEDNSEEACEEQWDAPQVVIDDNDGDQHKWIGLHAEPGDRSSYRSKAKTHSYECDCRLALSLQHDEKRATLLHEDYPVYELFAGHVKGGTLGKKIIKAYSRFDKLILALYYGGSMLVWNEEPDDLYYPSHD
ncbi:Uncharacterised protein [Yersinia kristensenii]|nr:Uncharacterised protein [Yersinia kristensenii]